jgi:hypothetical protein
MRKSPVAQERDRLQALDAIKKEIETRRSSEALGQEARAEARLVWLEQEVEKLRAERAKVEARMAALEARGRTG